MLSQLKLSLAEMFFFFWLMFQITPHGLTPINYIKPDYKEVIYMCVHTYTHTHTHTHTHIHYVGEQFYLLFIKGLNSPPLVKEKTYPPKAQRETEPSTYYPTIFSKVGYVWLLFPGVSFCRH